MASRFYGKFLQSGFDNGVTKINLASGGDTIKVALVTSSYTPNFDAHDFFDDVTNEITGTGYTAGGATLGSQTITLDTTNDRLVFDAADTSWATATLSARGAVVYKSTGVASTSPLIAYIDFTTDRTSDGGTFLITWHANGIGYLTYT
jgi:hypothetical protein